MRSSFLFFSIVIIIIFFHTTFTSRLSWRAEFRFDALQLFQFDLSRSYICVSRAKSLKRIKTFCVLSASCVAIKRDEQKKKIVKSEKNVWWTNAQFIQWPLETIALFFVGYERRLIKMKTKNVNFSELKSMRRPIENRKKNFLCSFSLVGCDDDAFVFFVLHNIFSRQLRKALVDWVTEF